MKIKYQFATEVTEIEVEEQWATILVDLDREEYNNDHKETRRHYSLEVRLYEGSDYALYDSDLWNCLAVTFRRTSCMMLLNSLLPHSKDSYIKYVLKGIRSTNALRCSVLTALPYHID